MKIHTIVRLVLCITGISTGITQAMDAPKATPSLFKGLGSWLRIASTPNEKFKQSIVVMLGLGSSIGMAWTGYSYYNDWYKKNFHHQFERRNATQACMRNETTAKVAKLINQEQSLTYHDTKTTLDRFDKENPTPKEQDIMANLASRVYLDGRNTSQFNSVFQSDSERTVSGIYQTCEDKNQRIDYTITGSKKGISTVTACFYEGETKMIQNVDVLKPYLDAQYNLELRKTQHAKEVLEYKQAKQEADRRKREQYLQQYADNCMKLDIRKVHDNNEAHNQLEPVIQNVLTVNKLTGKDWQTIENVMRDERIQNVIQHYAKQSLQDLKSKKTQLDEKVAEHATTPEFKTRYKEYKRNRRAEGYGVFSDEE